MKRRWSWVGISLDHSDQGTSFRPNGRFSSCFFFVQAFLLWIARPLVSKAQTRVDAGIIIYYKIFVLQYENEQLVCLIVSMNVFKVRQITRQGDLFMTSVFLNFFRVKLEVSVAIILSPWGLFVFLFWFFLFDEASVFALESVSVVA